MEDLFFKFEPSWVTREHQLMAVSLYSAVVLAFTFSFKKLERKIHWRKLWVVGAFLAVAYPIFLINVLAFDKYQHQSNTLASMIESGKFQRIEGKLDAPYGRGTDGIDRFNIGDKRFEIVQPHRNTLKGCFHDFLTSQYKLIGKRVKLDYLEVNMKGEAFKTLTQYKGEGFCIVRIEVINDGA